MLNMLTLTCKVARKPTIVHNVIIMSVFEVASQLMAGIMLFSHDNDIIVHSIQQQYNYIASEAVVMHCIFNHPGRSLYGPGLHHHCVKPVSVEHGSSAVEYRIRGFQL